MDGWNDIYIYRWLVGWMDVSFSNYYIDEYLKMARLMIIIFFIYILIL